MFDAGMEGVNWVRARVTVAPASNPLGIAIAAGGMAFSPVVTAVAQAAQSTAFTGTITSAASVVGPIPVAGMTMATVVMSGTYAGVTVLFDATVDGTNCIGTGFYTATNSVQQIDLPIGGYTQIRVRATAYTSGTANISVIAKGNGTVSVSAGTVQGSINNGIAIFSPPVFVGGTDGTNARSLFVKAPSVAPVATDQALVVGLSPNSQYTRCCCFTNARFKRFWSSKYRHHLLSCCRYSNN
jgi:hypothetical protein